MFPLRIFLHCSSITSQLVVLSCSSLVARIRPGPEGRPLATDPHRDCRPRRGLFPAGCGGVFNTRIPGSYRREEETPLRSMT
jgi:hypothetical protein